LFGQNVLPFLAIDPKEKADDQITSLRFLLEREEIYGLKLHTLATRSSAADLINSPFVTLAMEYELPMLIHSSYHAENTLPRHIFSLVDAYPQLKICIAHFGGFDHACLRKAESYANIFFDSSPFLSSCRLAIEGNSELVSPNRIDIDFSRPLIALRDLVTRFPGKILWGSDEPWTATSDSTGRLLTNFAYEDEKELIDLLSSISQTRLRLEIAHDNILRFLGG